MKLAKKREDEKMKRAAERAVARVDELVIDEAAVNDAIEDICEALEI